MFLVFYLLAKRKCNFLESAISESLLILKLILEFFFNNASTKTSCFTFVSEISTINSVEIFLQRKITRDTAPKSTTIEGNYIDGVIVHLGYIKRKLFTSWILSGDVFALNIETTLFLQNLAVYIQNKVIKNHFLVFACHIFYITDVERRKNLSAFVICNIRILFVF